MEEMTLKQLLKLLETNNDASMHMMLPSGEFIPPNFHITEVGRVQKNFIDCGGTRRELVSCVLQVWTADDKDHRLNTSKFSKILKMAESVLGKDDFPVEIEYGPDVVSLYVLNDVEVTPKGLLFVLSGKHTDCLAPDKCGITKCKNIGCC
jgi:hypothetical protein